jgi:hypothetical protein
MERHESIVSAEPSVEPSARFPATGQALGAPSRPPQRDEPDAWSPIIAAIERLEHDQETSALLSRAAAAVERSARRQTRLEGQLAELVTLLESADRYAGL